MRGSIVIRLTVSIDLDTKKTFDSLSDELIKKGIFRSKSELFECLIGWAYREKEIINWKEIKTYNII